MQFTSPCPEHRCSVGADPALPRAPTAEKQSSDNEIYLALARKLLHCRSCYWTNTTAATAAATTSTATTATTAAATTSMTTTATCASSATTTASATATTARSAATASKSTSATTCTTTPWGKKCGFRFHFALVPPTPPNSMRARGRGNST